MSSAPVRVLGTVHHTFIQAMMARGCIPESEARELYRAVLGVGIDGGYVEFLAALNAELDFAGFELRRIKTPDRTPKEFIGIVNKAS